MNTACAFTRLRDPHTHLDDIQKCQRFEYPDQASERFRNSGNTPSKTELIENVTTQLRAVFRFRGCAPSVAEDLAQKVAAEVESRVREVLRRPSLNTTWMSGLMEVGDLKLDLERHLFWRADEEVRLTPKEFDLLALMMKNVDILLPHAKILRTVWGLEYGGEREYLRTVVCMLRKKIEKNPANPEYIVNEPSLGYRFRAPVRVGPRLINGLQSDTRG